MKNLRKVSVVISWSLLFIVAGGTAHAAKSCAELENTALAEPAWYAAECLQPPVERRAPAAAPRSPSDVAFALDIGFVSDNFVTHLLGDFPGQTILGAQSAAIFGMDFDPAATTLYALNNDTQELGTLSLANGVFTAIGPSVPLAGHNWTGLSIDPVSGEFFAESVDGVVASLYSVNPATGAATLIGTETTLGLMIDIAINCAGVIYGHDIGTDSIYTIDRTTGLATLVGPTGVNSNFAQGMDFDNTDGTLYAYTYQGGGANQYGTIDLATGALTPLAVDNPLGEFEGATQTTCGIFRDGFESGDTSAWSSTVPPGGCNAGVCGAFETCSGSLSCFCGTAAEGGGFCFDDNVSCGALTLCPNGTSDCSGSEVCVVDTCCGPPVCIPPCGSVPPNLELGLGLTAAGRLF